MRARPIWVGVHVLNDPGARGTTTGWWSACPSWPRQCPSCAPTPTSWQGLTHSLFSAHQWITAAAAALFVAAHGLTYVFHQTTSVTTLADWMCQLILECQMKKILKSGRA
jgi:hypothetical protein